MKLTKEELEKWEASGEIKRMSHSNIVKGIVNMRHAKQFMADWEYKEFVLRYKKEYEIKDVYELTCAGFWNVVTDIVVRLREGSSINRFITNECVLKTTKRTLRKLETYKPYYIVLLGNLAVCTLISCIFNYMEYGFIVGNTWFFVYSVIIPATVLSAMVSVFSLLGIMIGVFTGRNRLGLLIQIVVSIVGIYIGIIGRLVTFQYTSSIF